MAIPETDLPIHPPRLSTTWREVFTPVDWVRLALEWRWLPKEPASSPQSIVLLPGLGASPASLSVLGAALKRQGHQAIDWGLGRNSGDVPGTLPKVIERFETVANQIGGPIVAIGWSLGGYLAREAARDRPDLVRQLITMGSPVVGGPTYTTAANWYRLQGVDLASLRSTIAQRYEIPLEVPTLALYTKNDGVVAWQACIDEWSPNIHHVEVAAHHLSLGTSASVIRVILEELDRSQPEEDAA